MREAPRHDEKQVHSYLMAEGDLWEGEAWAQPGMAVTS